MSIFESITYSSQSSVQQKRATELAIDLERLIKSISYGREAGLAITKLEECCMWINKAIRFEQIQRNGTIAEFKKADDLPVENVNE